MLNLLKLLALVLIALIPAVVLYLLFSELNSAGVTWLNESVQLGGPVAAFFAILYYLGRYLQRLEHDANPLLATLRKLEGDWKVSASSASGGKKAESNTKFSVDDGRLKLSGGSFIMSGDGAEPTLSGDWTCELAICDGNRLAYLYRLTDRRDEGPSVWQGFVDARRNPGSTIAFEGNWQVFGREHHEGRIRLEKL